MAVFSEIASGIQQVNTMGPKIYLLVLILGSIIGSAYGNEACEFFRRYQPVRLRKTLRG